MYNFKGSMCTSITGDPNCSCNSNKCIETIGCMCTDCDDWDIVKEDLCEYCQPVNVQKRANAYKIIQEQNRKFELKIKKIKDKRLRYEKKRNEKCKKNKLKQLTLYVNKMVSEDGDKKRLINGLCPNFNPDDLFCLKLLLFEN